VTDTLDHALLLMWGLAVGTGIDVALAWWRRQRRR
jgi:hypothetical protein